MPRQEMDTRFEKFGAVSFTATTKVNDFVDHLEKGRVAGTRCSKCGRKFFPPRADCYNCPGEPVEWFTVEGPGKLEAFSELRYAPMGFGDDLPYTIAVLAYSGFKLFGRIEGAAFEELQTGMEMEAKVKRLKNGQLTYVFERA